MTENGKGIGSGAGDNEKIPGIDFPIMPIDDLKIVLEELGYDIAQLDEQLAGLLNHELVMFGYKYHPENIKQGGTETVRKNANIDALRLIFIYGDDTSLPLRRLIDQLTNGHTHTANLSNVDLVREEADGVETEYTQDWLLYNIRLKLPEYIKNEMLKRGILLSIDKDESERHLSILSEIIRNCADGYTIDQLDADKIQIIKDHYDGVLVKIEEIIKIYAISIASLYDTDYFRKTVLGKPTPDTWQNVVDTPGHATDG